MSCTVNVAVSIRGGSVNTDYVELENMFQFYKFETVAASPSLGPETGGTVVQVHETPDVRNYSPLFRFVGVRNESIEGVRNEMGIASCESPAYSGLTLSACEGYSTSSLEISLNGQQYSPLGNFVYHSTEFPCLESVNPGSGPIDGGTNVSVAVNASSLRTFPVLFLSSLLCTAAFHWPADSECCCA